MIDYRPIRCIDESSSSQRYVNYFSSVEENTFNEMIYYRIWYKILINLIEIMCRSFLDLDLDDYVQGPSGINSTGERARKT